MNGGSLVAYAGAAILAALALALLVEGRLLRRGEPPITSYTRYAIRRWTVLAIAVVTLVLMSLSALWAHFIWDAACG